MCVCVCVCVCIECHFFVIYRERETETGEGRERRVHSFIYLLNLLSISSLVKGMNPILHMSRKIAEHFELFNHEKTVQLRESYSEKKRKEKE